MASLLIIFTEIWPLVSPRNFQTAELGLVEICDYQFSPVFAIINVSTLFLGHVVIWLGVQRRV